jgi:hypothetical protein
MHDQKCEEEVAMGGFKKRAHVTKGGGGSGEENYQNAKDDKR